MARSEEEKKAAQAAAHARWRASEKGKSYYAKRRKHGIQEGKPAGQEVQANGAEATQEAEAGK